MAECKVVAREPDDAWEEREARVEEAVARLDIVVLQSDPRCLNNLFLLLQAIFVGCPGCCWSW